MQAGGETLLFDCGRGITQRFQLGVKLGAANKLLLPTFTQPKLAVFYHFLLTGTPKVPLTEPEVVELTRKNYKGPLLAGEDLMAFRIGQQSVNVMQFDPAKKAEMLVVVKPG